MRKINRSSPSVEFSKWVANNRTAQWGDFVKNAHDLYLDVRDLLGQDQDGVSGYTEKPLGKEHIDHFKTRNLFPNPQCVFDWYNFVVDERDEPQFGSGVKDTIVDINDYNSNIIINPIVEDPHYFFTYSLNGEIIPRPSLSDVEKSRAIRTIELFNLNHQTLVSCRADIINFFQCLNDEYTIDQMENDWRNSGFYSLYDFYRENVGAF
ncbi:MAG: TIGR02646 family protein [Paludibacteraceae bacterium]|nr:TIGR02646 family protein [Paludibacteraceae bacterium]